MKSQFSGAYDGVRVLVTGHTGFKGSWLCLWLQALGARVTGLALPPSTTPSHWDLLALQDIEDVRVDLRDAAAVKSTIAHARPEVVFHLAAQPLVRRSYRDPTETFDTNIGGLIHLLEAVRNVDSVRVLVNATTDKVYREPAASPAGYAEDDPLGGHDPYSTSKACAELISDCYRKSFFSDDGPRTATARAGNVIGGGDWSEDRLVPDFVRAALDGKALPLRNPSAVRPWQHVLEPLSGYLRLGQMLLRDRTAESAWNFGPSSDATMSVLALATHMQAAWPGIEIDASPGPHPREAELLTLDCRKAEKHLGWTPVWNADTTIHRTIRWYREHALNGLALSSDDLARYAADAKTRGLSWAQ